MERLEPELQSHSLINSEFLVGREVPVEEPTLPHNIAACISDCVWCVVHEGSRIELLVDGARYGIGVGHYIRPIDSRRRARIGRITGGDDAVGHPAGDSNDAAHSPSAANGIQHSTHAGTEAPPFSKRKLIYSTRNE